jgi:GT2 family glycosyltransferase
MTRIPGVNPRVSLVISTHNRRDVLLRTLQHIYECDLDHGDFEILVVDNASLDGTAEAVASSFRDVRVFALLRNLGPCSKNIAIDRARGQYVVFLDDDSFPHPRSIQRMIEHFERDPALGAAVFTVTLPAGSRECCAYPSVFIGCGTGFRIEALKQVGGLPTDFFMAAEEYDLSLRLLDAGWDIRSFDDLHVTHLKTPAARQPWQLMRLDVRNNFILASRYLPKPWDLRFVLDWMLRYYHVACTKGQRSAFVVGLLQGALRRLCWNHRRPVSDEVFERFTMMRQIERRMLLVKEQLRLRSVLFVDYGKNILPYWLAARKCGLRIVAIADERLAMTGKYRGVPIIDDALARCKEFDAAIVSNMSPVHAELRAHAWRELDRRPVIDLFDPRGLEAAMAPASNAQQRAGLAA